jgi:GR25 family glycosyltransferase involved in LPS biosynthesis
MIVIDTICGLWINLDDAIDRRQSMVEQLEAAGLSAQYQRVAGVDGHKIAPDLARPGVVGCWLSHLRAIDLGRQSDRIVHIMEDDTWLGNFAKELFHAIANSAALAEYDLIFTDVLFDYLTSQRYFRAFYEAAQQVPPGGVPAQIHTIDLHGILFTGMNSYLIHPQRIGKVADLLHRTHQALDSLNPEPIDMAVRRFVMSGELRAAVTCPFLTSYPLQALADSQIENPADAELHRARWLESIHRQAFFYGADDRSLLAQLEAQFPTPISSPKSRLLGLLYEQFLIQSQQSF